MPEKNKQIGQTGEKLVHDVLIKKGYSFIEANKRIGRVEFDLIFSKNKKLFVFEVKTRTSKTYGEPEEAVTEKKLYNFYDCYHVLVGQYGLETIIYVVAAVYIDRQSNQIIIKFFKFN